MKTGMNELPPIRVEVPVCAFRPYASREYQDTFPFPAPSTVYGMLLSFLGVRRENKRLHLGVEMALAVDRLPAGSKVFRKLRRGPDLEDTRPDYQDLLIDLRLWIWLRKGEDQTNPPLSVRMFEALAKPEMIEGRCGGLSLGESSYLVDRIHADRTPPDALIYLVPDEAGFYSFPVWVDHQDSRNTIHKRFSIGEAEPVQDGLAKAWFKIGVP